MEIKYIRLEEKGQVFLPQIPKGQAEGYDSCLNLFIHRYVPIQKE